MNEFIVIERLNCMKLKFVKILGQANEANI